MTTNHHHSHRLHSNSNSNISSMNLQIPPFVKRWPAIKRISPWLQLALSRHAAWAVRCMPAWSLLQLGPRKESPKVAKEFWSWIHWETDKLHKFWLPTFKVPNDLSCLAWRSPIYSKQGTRWVVSSLGVKQSLEARVSSQQVTMLRFLLLDVEISHVWTTHSLSFKVSRQKGDLKSCDNAS